MIRFTEFELSDISMVQHRDSRPDAVTVCAGLRLRENLREILRFPKNLAVPLPPDAAALLSRDLKE